MWICISKKLVRTGAQIVKQVSNFADDLGESLFEAKKVFLNDQDNNKNVKSLKIAILGLPNAGKSTLINHLIGRPVCAASKKIHTTRNKAAAVFCTDDTQLIFIDTPGLVGKGDIKKYKLEDSFKNDPKNSIQEADIIGVIQDMSIPKARESINEKIISVLQFSKKEKNSVLILNKIDTLKNKKILLEVVRNLTNKNMWPNFSDIFMISALTGDGVNDLRNYFIDSAKNKNWDYDQETFTNQAPEIIIQQTIRAKLLDDLSQEIPYLLKIAVEHIEYCEDGSMNIISNINTPSVRITRLIIGKSGERIKKLAREAEQILCQIFQKSVRLKIMVCILDELIEKK